MNDTTHMLLGTLLGCLGAVGCESSPPTPADPPPLVEREPEESVDLEPARAMFTEFLDARWSLHEADAVEYVTEADREHVWPLAFQPYFLKMVPDEVAVGDWYDWRILELQARDPSTIDARVEVVMPTIESVPPWGLQTTMAQMHLMTTGIGGQDRMKRIKRISTVRDVLVPPRRVVVMEYRLVLVAGEWRVLMGWEHYPPVEEKRINVDPPEVDLDFDGSEKWWLRRRQKKADPEESLTEPQQRLLGMVEDAERMVRRKQFDQALRLYESILVDEHAPDFLADRPAQIAEMKQRWESKLKAASVVFSASARSDRQGQLIFDVTMENEGSHALQAVRAVLEFDNEAAARAGNCRFREVAAGAEVTTPVKTYTKNDTVPGVKRIRVVDLRFEERKLEQKFAPPDDSAFKHQLDDFETGGAAATRLHRILQTVKGDSERLDACPDWPADPIDVRLDVDAHGDVTRAGVRTGGVSAAFSSCVEEALSALTFAEPDDGWAVVLQLMPPDFWK